MTSPKRNTTRTTPSGRLTPTISKKTIKVKGSRRANTIVPSLLVSPSSKKKVKKNKLSTSYRDELLSFRETLIQSSFQISDHFVGRIFWFSAGAISLSLVMIKDSVINNAHCSIFLMFLSFIFAMLFAFGTYITSQQATQLQIINIDNKLIQKTEQENYHAWNLATLILEKISFGLLIFGSVILIFNLYIYIFQYYG